MRPRKVAFGAVALTMAIGIVLGSAMLGPAPVSRSVRAQTVSLTFGYGGDIGWNATARTRIGLAKLRSDLGNLSFFLALGDLSYNSTPGSEPSWCNFINWSLRKPATFPFEIVSGNHESNGPEGYINNFVKCEPNKIPGINGTYGKEYFFDYPSSSPLARVILISPALSFSSGAWWSYTGNSTHEHWLLGAIDSARAQAIPWVIVGMHKVCLSVGPMQCEISQELMDLLLEKKVDLVLQAHDHTYQRSKQLSCALREVGMPNCIANGQSPYVRGAGTVFSVCGVLGQWPWTVHPVTDDEAAYFAASMGGNTPGMGNGFCRITLTASTLSMNTMFSGTYADSFTIAGAAASVVTFSAAATTDEETRPAIVEDVCSCCCGTSA